MPRDERHTQTIPYGTLGIVPLASCSELGKKVNNYLVDWREQRDHEDESTLAFSGYKRDSYIVSASTPRFGSGEGKGVLNDSVRGYDLYIMVDVCNYSLEYSLCGYKNHMSPDDHYADLKRVIAAAGGKARRITVIMPFLYESRQHKRSGRESLDCALALKELTDMGVDNIITFDAHDPRVCNAIPLMGFDNVVPSYQVLKAMFHDIPHLRTTPDEFMVISPDEGALNRNMYYASMLGVPMGMFYKRRDYSIIVNGRNPIVAHEFLGANIKGKTVIIIDDMISSGESMLDVAKQLKDRNAGRVFVCTTFGLFTDGFDKFDEYYNKGYISKVITTNLTYLPPELYEKPYFVKADMSKFIALIIDSLNHDVPISSVISPTDKIHALLEKREKGLL